MRRGQEEMVGFILVVVLVLVIMVVVLGIVLRQDESGIRADSVEISQFLGSAMRFTTDCAIGFEPNFQEIRELALECNANSNERCLSGELVCEKLSEEVLSILGSSWNVGEDAEFKGYEFTLDYTGGTSPKSLIAEQRGNCSSGNIVGGVFSSRDVETRLDICS